MVDLGAVKAAMDDDRARNTVGPDSADFSRRLESNRQQPGVEQDAKLTRRIARSEHRSGTREDVTEAIEGPGDAEERMRALLHAHSQQHGFGGPAVGPALQGVDLTGGFGGTTLNHDPFPRDRAFKELLTGKTEKASKAKKPRKAKKAALKKSITSPSILERRALEVGMQSVLKSITSGTSVKDAVKSGYSAYGRLGGKLTEDEFRWWFRRDD